jgi:hypothetical protein
MTRKMTFNYQIVDVVSDYNKDLYNEVLSKIEIELKKDYSVGWTAKIKDNKAIITYNKAESPDACFSHELLHIKYELNGLGMPFVKDEEGISTIMPFIFNQLCHLKIYPDFYAMGFENEEFLNDKDKSDTIRLATRDIKSLKEIHVKTGNICGSTALLMPYLVLKSPNDKSDSTMEFIKVLRSYGDSNFFDEVDLILNEWIMTDSLDSSLTFARLFKACNMPKVGFCLSGEDQDIIIAGNLK